MKIRPRFKVKSKCSLLTSLRYSPFGTGVEVRQLFEAYDAMTIMSVVIKEKVMQENPYCGYADIRPNSEISEHHPS